MTAETDTTNEVDAGSGAQQTAAGSTAETTTTQPEGGEAGASEQSPEQQMFGETPNDQQQAGEATPPTTEDSKPAEGKETDTGVVSYEFTAPEGRQFDETVIGEFGKLSQELGISNEAAQKLLDGMSPALEAQAQRTQTHNVEQAKQHWEKLTREDEELSTNLDENLAMAKKVYDLGSPELRELLESTGLGSHPEFIRLAKTLGEKLSPDTFVASGSQGGKPQTLAERLYPNQGKK